MKFRTDFVTNSSDTSFLIFNIQNIKLFDFLENLGIKIECHEKGVFSQGANITLPSGESAQIDVFDAFTYPYVSQFTSISAWLVGTLLYEFDYVSEVKSEEYFSEFTKELVEILNKANITNLDRKMIETWSRDLLVDQLSKLDAFDAEIKSAVIERQSSDEEGIGGCEKTIVSAGKKTTVNYPHDDWDEGNDIDADLCESYLEGGFFELAEEKGLTSTVIKIWEDGHWVRIHSEKE